ncbi:hypothetical protein DEU53_102160 [Pantoea sp. AG1095]|nr:hypothetical protein [Pantoea sp. SORGH_AS_0659]PYG50202.1 hypothetical protein DEU53_102160 [Pantoea sp. AG1095]
MTHDKNLHKAPLLFVDIGRYHSTRRFILRMNGVFYPNGFSIVNRLFIK